MRPTQYSSLAQSVADRAKQLNVVLRREITKIRSFEAEQAQAHKTTIFSEASMTVSHVVGATVDKKHGEIRHIPP